MSNSSNGADKKIVAGICGILLGMFGVHKFILGYTSEAVLMLVLSIAGIVFACFIVPAVAPLLMWVFGLIEGIIYLTKSDDEFVETYINNKKGWF
jgi:TM2 domain-containing membrane protein YozV